MPGDLRVDIAVYDGVDELDALGPLEVFRSAGITTRLVTLAAQEVAVGAHHVRVMPDAVHDGATDVLVVTGGGWVARAERGAWAEVQRGDWLDAIRQFNGHGTLAGVCTGTMLLAHAGVVGSRRATTHHSAWADLTETGATVLPDRVVDDGNLVTCGGVTSGIDLALWIVERERSRALADKVAERMEYARVRPRTAPA